MSSDLRARAEARLIEAAGALGLADPRPPLRERLKRLRESHPQAFARAVSHYETRVLPDLAGTDPVGAWLEYGRYLGELTGDGRLTAIDATGRAQTFAPPAVPGSLILFLPQEAAADVLVAALPQQPSAAQHAALELLVNRRLELPDG